MPIRWSECLLLATTLLLPTVAGAVVATPTVSGPILGPGVPFVASTTFALGPVGYVEEEFFLAGPATAHTSAAALGSDGRWTAAPGNTAPFTTRILVRRPADPAVFNGTVVVEWLNVSAGLDAAPDWIFAHTLLMREGYVWVGVSAQNAGINGGSGGIGIDLSLKSVNPTRYAPLEHPGDSFSYDMFSQVAAALRTGSPSPLGGLAPEFVIAVGESQSAFRLTTYVNAVHPLAGVYDAFLVHSRSGGAAALSQAPEAEVPAPTPTRIREDVDVPVLVVQSETDLVLLGYAAARQRDRRRVRVWEIAGTAHGDVYQLLVGMADQGPAAADTTYYPPTPSPIPGIIDCGSPINAGPHHYVLSAAVAQLDRWARGGKPASRGRRLQMDDDAFVLDRHGNVRGGIRTPQVDVPIAMLSGLGQTGATFCRLFGTTIPFDDATLASLYKTHAKYVLRVRRAARRATRAGFLLPLDAEAMVAAAEASDIGG